MAHANVTAVDKLVDVIRTTEIRGLAFSDEGLRRIARWFLDGDIEPAKRPRRHLWLVK